MARPASPSSRSVRPESRPDWIETVELSFPSGRTADEIVIRDAAQLAWIVNLGCIDLNPHPVRAEDLDHPDELRVDLDPVPGVPWDHVRQVALVVRESLEDLGLVGWPKTSGSRGIHINVRIEPRWTFPEVRRAALALARDVERRAPGPRHQPLVEGGAPRRVHRLQPERQGPHRRVRLLRAPDPRRPGVDAAALGRGPGRRDGGLHPRDRARAVRRARATRRDGIDEAVGSLEALLELSARHEAEGQGDAPWPPHYAKPEGEPPRVAAVEAAPSDLRVRALVAVTARSQPDWWRSQVRPPTGRRKSSIPVVEIARAEHKEEALEGLERWKARHPEVVPHLEPADILVDAMRGRSTAWYRVRVNLIHVPAAERPTQEALDTGLRPVGRIRMAGPLGSGRAGSSQTDHARSRLTTWSRVPERGAGAGARCTPGVHLRRVWT